ncbi:MAG: DUF349 domain-containing protein [Propionibacteriaceae bacterium]|nr:DUF349 domain-containing protein [Propionibacteriaceae bacterium]
MTEMAGPASWGRVDDDGSVFVVTAGGERKVGQIPDSTPEEALAFFQRRFEALTVEAGLLSQRVKRGALGPDEAPKAIARLQAEILSANAVGDLVGLAASLAPLTEAAAEAAQQRRQEKAQTLERARERKHELVAQAETLAQSDDWRNGTARFRDLVAEWKTLPRLSKSDDEELWQRLAGARATHARRRREHYADLEEVHQTARQAKEAIIQQAEALADSTDWGPTATQFRQLMDRWRTVGSAGRAADDELWGRFRGLQDNFFNRRSAVFTAQESEFQTNLEAKVALLGEAEKTILPITDPAAARNAYRELLGQFNQLGKVPREQIRAVDGRLRALEAAVGEAERREWARTDPQTRVKAEGTVNLFTDKLDRLRGDLERARAKGDAKKAQSLEAQLASLQALLDQATATLDEISA